jgi:glycosyltransferase involved in cell wall biosynthesis
MATLARALPAHGVQPLLVATHGPTDSPLIRETADAGVRIEHLGMRSMVDPRGPSRLRDLVRETGTHLVHTRTIRADLVGRSAHRLEVAVVNNVVNLYPEDCLVRLGPVVGRATMSLLRSTTGSVDRFVANSRAVAANVPTAFGVEPERVQVVYDGLPAEPWRSAGPADLSVEGIEFGVPLAVTVARLHPQKGLEDLVDAAAMIAARTGLHFAIAGEGPSRASLEARIRAAGLEGRVALLGERLDVPGLLAGASLFVLPSHFEGLPSAIIEAMMASCPVVATTVGGNPELVVDGETGWLVPPGDPAALADVLVRAIGSDLDGVGAAGARRAEERFSVDTMTIAFAALYREVLEARAPSEPGRARAAAAGAVPPA